jgi:hypothetical protein
MMVSRTAQAAYLAHNAARHFTHCMNRSYFIVSDHLVPAFDASFCRVNLVGGDVARTDLTTQAAPSYWGRENW